MMAGGGGVNNRRKSDDVINGRPPNLVQDPEQEANSLQPSDPYC